MLESDFLPFEKIKSIDEKLDKTLDILQSKKETYLPEVKSDKITSSKQQSQDVLATLMNVCLCIGIIWTTLFVSCMYLDLILRFVHKWLT